MQKLKISMENFNGKLQRFITANYGIKDKDFFLYRVAGYFSGIAN
jgi:hypothetical protein